MQDQVWKLPNPAGHSTLSMVDVVDQAIQRSNKTLEAATARRAVKRAAGVPTANASLGGGLRLSRSLKMSPGGDEGRTAEGAWAWAITGVLVLLALREVSKK